MTAAGSLREAFAVACVAGAVGAATVLWISLGRATPFAPGELDLLLTARAIAGGRAPSLWLGAVHPDAIGTYLGSALLAPLLRAGLGGAVALKLLAAGHFAVLVGATAGLTTRLGGRAAGAFAGAVLLLGAPALVAAHTKYLGTTSEVAALEIALLWWLYECTLRRRRLALVAGGVACGVGVAWSLHALWLALVVPVAWIALTRDRRGALAWIVPTLLVATPALLASDPLSPPSPMLSVKSLPLTTLPGLADPSDLAELAARLPWALLPETSVIPPDSGLRVLFVPWMGALCLAVLATLVRPRARPFATVLAAFVVGAGAPLLVAGDLIGYPAGYRYVLPCLPGAAALLALTLRDLGRPRAVFGAAFAALSVGALALPGATAQELDARGAAFFAAQHRLTLSDRPLHTHFLTFLPYVTARELPGWVEGYGLHTAREWAARLEVLDIEFSDAMTSPGGRPPPSVDRRFRRRNPAHWLEIADVFDEIGRERFFVGLGLGVAEDGALDAAERKLVGAVRGPDAGALWLGIGGALGERIHHGVAQAAVLEGADTPGFARAPERAFKRGLDATAGPGSWTPPEGAPLFQELRAEGPDLRVHPHPFSLRHPLTYGPLGTAGRAQRAATAAP